MIVVLWALLNIVLAILTVFGVESAGMALAWSIIIGWAIALIMQATRN